MNTPELDPERGAKVAEELQALGVTGILITAARAGYITKRACQMPSCLCPQELGGPHYFEPVPEEIGDWIPTPDHIVLKSAGGHLTVDNVRLAHRLCNRVDYAVTHEQPHKKDLDRVEAARLKAIERQSQSAEPPETGRRDRILKGLAELWTRSPDSTLGELLGKLFAPGTTHPFELADAEIERGLSEALRGEPNT